MAMDTAQQRLVVAQFGPRAAAYVESAVHAQGEDLDYLAEVLRDRPNAHLLDLGCGGGHVSLKLAPLVRHVTAFDLAAPMLAAVAQRAAQRGLSHLVVAQGAAESLPFADGSFDVVTSRYSAHHWSDLGTALHEARRVLAPGGLAIFIDVVAPERPVLDTYLQSVELLRDPSHVRDYARSEWLRALAAAGFVPHQPISRRLRLEFSSWTARMNTPKLQIAAIRALQDHVAEDVHSYFAIEADGSFTLDTATFEAQC